MISAACMQIINGTAAVIRSQVMQRLMGTVQRIAVYETAVLIVGETGSGKELVARAVHERSPRCGKPFVDVNCAALPEHLVESELFGYEKGAFSGADASKAGLFDLANSGTIFLDEIGELDIKVQAKLLRVLDGAGYYRLGGSRKADVNVRVIAATTRDLEQDVKAGNFEATCITGSPSFTVSPRCATGWKTSGRWLSTSCTSTVRMRASRLTPWKRLRRYSWPGNAELKNVIFKITVSAPHDKRQFRAVDLPAVIYGVPEIP
jgi:transcriptional regulator with GAF, ATPase, and Fis domain